MRVLGFMVPVLVVGGCQDWRTALFGPRPVDDTAIVDSGAPLGCDALDGTYVADTLDFASESDPDVYEDYGDYPDYTLVLDADSQTFESMLVLGDTVLVESGTYTVIGDRLVLEAPFIEGVGDGETVLGCDYDGTSLTLYGPTDYDFLDDQVEGYVEADFIGDFVLVEGRQVQPVVDGRALPRESQ